MTAHRFSVRAAARADLDAIVDHFLAKADEDIASRFIESARLSFHAIAASPGMGTPLNSRNPRLAKLRKWRVDGFRSYLIFYQPGREAIRIIRVLHAAQDWWALLDSN